MHCHVLGYHTVYSSPGLFALILHIYICTSRSDLGESMRDREKIKRKLTDRSQKVGQSLFSNNDA